MATTAALRVITLVGSIKGSLLSSFALVNVRECLFSSTRSTRPDGFKILAKRPFIWRTKTSDLEHPAMWDTEPLALPCR